MSITRNVIFKSAAFNTTERKDYFINDCCFGDDVALWFIQELRRHGLTAEDEPGQEDFGWYLNFRAGEMDYCFIISYRPAEYDMAGDWMGTIERITGVGVFGFFFGAAKRGIQLPGPQAIHTVLSSSPQISDIQWFTDEDYKTEKNGKKEPAAA